jgi:transpeptidase family protein/penicillin-binding protein/MecA-like transpeptidase family protein
VITTRAVGAVLAVVVMASACTQDEGPPPLPSARAAAEEFVAAWDSGDFDAMAEMIAPSGGAWTEERLAGLFDRASTDGAIESYDVSLPAAVEETPGSRPSASPLTATADVAVDYVSTAAARPLSFEGSMTLVLERGADEWAVEWKKSMLWPGIDGAVGFRVESRWLERGAILDRNKRPLARRGPPDERFYPYGALAGSTVGNLEPLTKKDVADGPTGVPGDLAGGSGLEAAFQDTLAGTPTAKVTVVDKHDEVLDVVGRLKGRPGASVRTTLDVDVQRAAESAYGDTVGGAVVMDPGSGDLLAIVSSSPFDPNNYVGIDITPFNRALSGLYPPGSSMKVVTSAAALDTGTVTPETAFPGPKEYQGVRNFEGEHFTSLSFASALKFSVNTIFAQVALKLGGKELFRYAKAFGFNSSPKMPLGAATSSFPFPEDAGDLMFGAIGQAQVVATPLQMASVAAAVANGGKRMEPRISFDEKKSGVRIMKPKTASQLTEMMIGVVIGGTGSAANVTGLDVAGKTGTAEVDIAGKRKNHAWFICFAPGHDPKLAVAVVSELGGVGGEVAAPLARQILLGAIPYVS